MLVKEHHGDSVVDWKAFAALRADQEVPHLTQWSMVFIGAGQKLEQLAIDRHGGIVRLEAAGCRGRRRSRVPSTDGPQGLDHGGRRRGPPPGGAMAPPARGAEM